VTRPWLYDRCPLIGFIAVDAFIRPLIQISLVKRSPPMLTSEILSAR
jgi:hypothetical protein